MWRINSVFIFMLSILLTNESYGTVIWEENFDTPNLGVWGDDDGESLHINLNQGENWSINFDDCSLTAEYDYYVKTVSTSAGRFEALDCDGEAIWYWPRINISNYTEVNCELENKEPAGNEGEWIWTGQQSDGTKCQLDIYSSGSNSTTKMARSNSIKKHAASPTVWNDAATTLSTTP